VLLHLADHVDLNISGLAPDVDTVHDGRQMVSVKDHVHHRPDDGHDPSNVLFVLAHDR